VGAVACHKVKRFVWLPSCGPTSCWLTLQTIACLALAADIGVQSGALADRQPHQLAHRFRRNRYEKQRFSSNAVGSGTSGAATCHCNGQALNVQRFKQKASFSSSHFFSPERQLQGDGNYL